MTRTQRNIARARNLKMAKRTGNPTPGVPRAVGSIWDAISDLFTPPKRRLRDPSLYSGAHLRALRAKNGVGRPAHRGKRNRPCPHDQASPRRTWAETIGRGWTTEIKAESLKVAGRLPLPRRQSIVIKGRDQFGQTRREVIDAP